MDYYFHETAIIDEGALVSEGCKIWQWVHVCSGAKLGKNTTLGQNVYVGGKADVGQNVKVQNNVSIYDNVLIEDDVFCGPSVVFTNVYNPRAFIERKTEYRETRVCRGATLGANCTVVCGVIIGQYALVGAGAVVNKNVPDFALVVGTPARQIGWVSRFGDRLNFSERNRATCPNTGDVYELKNNNVFLLESGE